MKHINLIITHGLYKIESLISEVYLYILLQKLDTIPPLSSYHSNFITGYQY